MTDVREYTLGEFVTKMKEVGPLRDMASVFWLTKTFPALSAVSYADVLIQVYGDQKASSVERRLRKAMGVVGGQGDEPDTNATTVVSNEPETPVRSVNLPSVQVIPGTKTTDPEPIRYGTHATAVERPEPADQEQVTPTTAPGAGSGKEPDPVVVVPQEAAPGGQPDLSDKELDELLEQMNLKGSDQDEEAGEVEKEEE